MTNLLPTMLRMCQHAGPVERKQLVKQIPPDMRHLHNGKVVKVRELLLTEAIESTTLIQAEIYRTVIEGAEPVKCMRDALPVIRTNSNSVTINKGETGTYASVVAEAAEIPVLTQDYTAVTFTIVKYGVRPLISREMIDDALFDVVNLEVQKAGARVENALNQEALSQILEDSGTSHDTAGSNQGVKAIAKAIGVVKAAGFMPDVVIMHPDAEAIVLTDYVPAGGYYAVGDLAVTGKLPPVLGLKPLVCGVTDTSSTYTWDYDADNEIGMLIIDSKSAGAIVMRQDLRVEKFADPIRDLLSMSVTMRVDADSLHANATCRVLY